MDVSAATAAEPRPKAADESVPTDSEQTKQIPGHRSAGSDDRIYDIVGPDPAAKPGLQSR